jgi:uncharacterized repeat protein (TIGR02543 family)
VLHEYAHYLDGTYGLAWGRYPGNPQTPHWNSVNTTGFYAIHYDLTSGNTSGCFTPLSNNVSDWISLYGFNGSYNCPQAGQRIPVEDFAEAFAFYVMSGLDYRTAATQSTMIAQQYTWLKDNVFQGVEYDTALPEGSNSGCNDVPGTASRQPAHVRCDDNFVWDFTIPHGVTNGSCGSSHGATLSAAPTKNLCSHGAPTLVSGSGPWTWSCNGLNGGTATSCAAYASLLPDPPTNISATAGDGQATISFNAPTYLGGNAIIDYTVNSSRGETQTGVASPITIHGLTNGLHYSFTVTARNASGSSTSLFSSNDVLPLGLPGAPTNVVATAGNLQASVSFSTPAANGGATIGNYTVTSSPGNLTASGSASPIIVSGLTNGLTYTFTVSASNVIGTGPDSAPSTQVLIPLFMLPTVSLDSVTPPALPTNWQSVVQIGSAGAWFTNAGTHVPAGIASHSGNNLVYFNSSSAGGNQYAKLISPSFSLVGVTGAKVSFWMYRDPTSSTLLVSDTLDVYLNTNNTLTGATKLTTTAIPRSRAYPPSVSTGGWYHYQYDIPASFSGSSNYVIFYGYSAGGGNDIHLDDITIATLPAAPGIGSAQPGNGSASIAFTAKNDGGSPISAYTANCTPVAGGATLTGTGSSSPILVSALSNGTNYNCSVTATSIIGISVASGTVAVTPLSNAVYAVTYDGNTSSGGTVPTDAGTYAQGVTVTVLGNSGSLVKTGYTFAGWNTAANGTGTSQAAVSSFNMGSTNVTLYAQWTLIPINTSISLIQGWNLLGNSNDAPLDVTTTLNDSTTVTTVWKWNPATTKWAFYAPSMTASELATYTLSKGYEALSTTNTINGGEGFWVNAKIGFAVQMPAGNPIVSAYFQDNASDPTQNKLLKGWNLIATGNDKTPSDFNKELSPSTQGTSVIPNNLITLWAWDSAKTNWYFYAPNLEASSTLVTYIANKFYLDFSATNKMLGQGVGFWVNKQ